MNKTCFLVCPIGEEGSDIRKNSDSLMEFIIEPVCREHNYKVVRADKIFSNDKINDTILNHLRNDELVIADLSTNNANVLYELGYRTATSKPIIQIATEGPPLPFDVSSIRTHFYNLSDIRKSNKFKENLSKIIQQVEKEELDRIAEINKNQMDEVFTPDFQRSMFSTLFSAVLENPEKFQKLSDKNEEIE